MKSEIRHGTTPQKIAATEAIPTVIEDGQVVFSDVKPGTDVDRIVIAAPITIGEEHYYMGVMLQRDKTNQRLYMHDVTLEKETSGESQATLNKTGALDPEGRFFMKMLLQNAINVKYEMRRTKENNLQISEKDAQTAAEIDRKVKHSLGIAAVTDTEKSLAARVTELESVNRDLERQVKDYRLQMKAGGAQHVTDIRKVKDGRSILYDINKISPIGRAVVASSSKLNEGRSTNTADDNQIVSQSTENVNPDQVQVLEEDARTDTDIDERVKNTIIWALCCKGTIEVRDFISIM